MLRETHTERMQRRWNNFKATPTALAMKVLGAAIRRDPAYRLSWRANLAMAARDEGLETEAANRSADRFLSWAFEEVSHV